MVVTKGNESGRTNRDGICAQGESLCHIGAAANTAGDDELDLPVHIELLQSLYRGTDCRQRWNTAMLDENLLRCSGAALHAIEDNDVGSSLYGEGCVIVGAGGADLNVDRLFPIRDFAELLNLDFKVIGTGPIGMA